MPLPLRRLFGLLTLSAAGAFAQTPAFTIVNTGLDATFGNAGKGIFDPQVSGLTGVAFGNGLFVAIGASGSEDVLRWATSPDGTTWTARSQALPGGMKTFTQSRVHFLNGKFLFFAEHTLPNNGGGVGLAYSSADGLTWTASNTITNGRMLIVEFDASSTLTVAASTNGAQYASADLVTWTSRPVVPNAAGFDHLDLAFGAGKFFSSINGFGGTTYSSADAVTWTSLAQANVVGGSRVASGNGMVILIAGNNRYRTTDGSTFTAFTAAAPSGFLVPGGDPWFAGGRFIASAVNLSTLSQAYLASSDGQTWTNFATFPLPPSVPAGQSRSYLPNDIAFGNGKYVIAGNDVAQTISTRTTLPLIWILDAAAAPTPPAISTQPAAANAVLGGSAVFSVVASGSGNTYQWRKDGVAISGATSATLTLSNISATSVGSYSVVITNSAGSATSNAATLTLVAANAVGRIINLSILTSIASAGDSFTMGYVVGGSGTSGAKPLVIRAAGPSLGALGVPGTLDDPKMELFAGSTKTGENDNWGGAADLTAALASVGAFAYTGPTSRDAAALANITTRDNSVKVSAANNTSTGTVIAEVYDATPGSSFAVTTPRLLNVSVIKNIGAKLTAGFVIGGQTSKTVLIRAVGPGLAGVGVTSGTVADPQLVLFGAGATRIGENNDWGGTAALNAAFTAVGAFNLPASSKDAALVATLQPGSYTVEVSPATGASGLALIEVYDVP